MLQIKIEPKEYFDEQTMEFIYVEGCILNLEHSLVSLAKWEEKYRKPFLNPIETSKTIEESIYYIKCMTLNEVNPLVYNNIKNSDIQKVYAYINDTPTATTFSKINNTKSSNKILTAEVIYFMMFSNQIPYECEKWNLNKLLVLLKVFSEENKPPKKMSRSEIMKQNSALNKARKSKRR